MSEPFEVLLGDGSGYESEGVYRSIFGTPDSGMSDSSYGTLVQALAPLTRAPKSNAPIDLSVIAAMQSEIRSVSESRVASPAHSNSRLLRLLSVKTIVATVATVALTATAAAAATGSLPRGVQHIVSRTVADTIGITLPDPTNATSAPTTTVAPTTTIAPTTTSPPETSLPTTTSPPETTEPTSATPASPGDSNRGSDSSNTVGNYGESSGTVPAVAQSNADNTPPSRSNQDSSSTTPPTTSPSSGSDGHGSGDSSQGSSSGGDN